MNLICYLKSIHSRRKHGPKTHSPCCQSFLTIKNIYSANLLAFLLLSQNHFYILSLLYRHISMRLSNGNPSLYKTNSLIFLLHIHSMSLTNNPCMFLPKANLMLYLYMISEATFDSFASYMLYKQSLSCPKLNPTPWKYRRQTDMIPKWVILNLTKYYTLRSK